MFQMQKCASTKVVPYLAIQDEFETVLRCADALGLRRRKRVQRHQTDAFIAGAGRESGTRAMKMRVSVDWRRSVAWRR